MAPESLLWEINSIDSWAPLNLLDENHTGVDPGNLGSPGDSNASGK